MTETPETTPTPTGQLRPERLGSSAELRPERLGERDQLRPGRLGEPLTAEEVERRAAELPCWQVVDDTTALERTFSFPSLRAAVAFVAMVAEIGEADGYVPDVDLRLLEVNVRIDTHVGEALTDLDFQVARSLGAV